MNNFHSCVLRDSQSLYPLRNPFPGSFPLVTHLFRRPSFSFLEFHLYFISKYKSHPVARFMELHQEISNFKFPFIR